MNNFDDSYSRVFWVPFTGHLTSLQPVGMRSLWDTKCPKIYGVFHSDSMGVVSRLGGALKKL